MKFSNPIEAAIISWFILVDQDTPSITVQFETLGVHHDLIDHAPKRWTVYEPMVLLPAGSFTNANWTSLISSLTEDQLDKLWQSILNEISKKSGCSKTTPLTHLAVNEGISLHAAQDDHDDAPEENILRSPGGLRMLHGDFGPSGLSSPDQIVTGQDFENAFWVSTRQNGIYQTWAPRWTMFSRGNIKEKARLLSFHDAASSDSQNALPHRVLPAGDVKEKWAIDMYAGIGYFVFCYAKMGLRVLCWELNPWSVEGLRRGADVNGWSVKVVQGAELEGPMEKVMEGGERIVVFLENNRKAQGRIRDIRRLRGEGQLAVDLEVRHVNCGLLPTSKDSWADVWDIVREGDGQEAWLHLHENVGVADIETRKAEIQQLFDGLDPEHQSGKAVVAHVELVKTFAPGVWHCVFDVYITRSSGAA
ncbi:tRNA wybutosine-synthesizing protein 2 [Pseudomassariella vexata]|uniref:tRNA wybutosine-synthesizing protein 2 n=1 Tax=Pseudomassariella vexata TaxID=1141098 RepID=A0A1Y2DL09_9PEZI|nr:tRNA wybutosine-synthesizing protein 2 [Pseudomassariella vexata]ORY59978.1 tRNA wybutosine-synthesizing protein 2 [Pseudomassariella vexata]